VQTARYNRFSVPALRVGARIDVAHVADDRHGVLVLVAKFSKKCRGLRRHLALQVGELLHGVIWSLCKRPSCTPEPLLYGPLLRLKTYIASNLPLRLSSCDFVLCLVAGSLSGEGGGCLLAPTRILLLPLPLS